jgi:hypothetical protein
MPIVSKRKRISQNAIKTRWIDHNPKLMEVDSLPEVSFLRVNTSALKNDFLTKKVIENFSINFSMHLHGSKIECLTQFWVQNRV